ncbi:MAG: universal stress protein [Bdellovibrionales bacterium]|nr:universal stress protein [Bdellovibrionales bacterium]
MSKILLAIDPLEKKLKPSEGSLRVLRNWLRQTGSKVEAVYVQSESVDLTEMAEAVHRLDLSLEHDIEARVLVTSANTQKEVIKRFVEYIRESEVEFVVLLSHGRKWLSRLVLGSFSEGILADSPVPVVFLGSEPTPGAHALYRVMFPTDFSEASKKAFQNFLAQVETFRPDVILYHYLSTTDFIYEYAGISWDGYLFTGATINDQRDWVYQEGENWARLGVEHGLKVKVVVEEGSESPAKAILSAADKFEVSLLGLASTQRPLESVIVGSLARDVFRSRKMPVWVMGPASLKEYRFVPGISDVNRPSVGPLPADGAAFGDHP